MTTWILPADGTKPNHSFRTSLDGITYELQLRWNQRSSSWQLTLFDAFGNVVLGSRRLNPGSSLIGRLRRLVGYPPGDLVPLDTTGQDAPMTQPDELGTRVQLLYVEAADLP